MAYSNGDKYAPLVVEWNQAITEYVPTWNRFCNVRADNAIALQNYADIKPATLGTWNGSEDITATSYGSFAEQTVTAQGHATRVDLTRRDVGLDPGLVERKAAEMLEAAQLTIESSVFSALEGGFSESVDNGAGGTTNVLGGTFVLADASTQTNGLTAALSATSLASARQKLMEWKNYNGDPMGLGMGNLALIVSPQNHDLAIEITKSPMLREVTSDASNNVAVSGANINPQADRPYDVIVSPFLTADPDDWFLVQTGAQSPVYYWTAAAPHLIIQEDEVNQKVVMSVSLYHKVYIQTPPNGIIASNVA
jgi:hypothetical protein